jgi:prepilin-type N-terminal cleavage/methylation domain-containing protein
MLQKGTLMRKDAFTMMEIIFVIVIIGILSAVVLPKLNATRDDADVSQIGSLIGTGIQEIADYVTSKGQVKDDFSIMSNCFAILKRKNIANLTNKKATIKINGNDCMTVEIVSHNINNGITEDVTINHTNTSDKKCSQLQAIVDPETYSVPISGTSINY